MNKLLCFLLFISLAATGQDRKTLQGRVMADESAMPYVYVINKKAGIETKTDGNGNFAIEAKNGDIITIYSNRTEVRDFIISELSFKDMPYILSVKATAYELDEVVINEQVTAESLNIVPKGQKKYTPAERRLRTATNMTPHFFIGTMPGIGVPTDAILNAISGRTKMLKKALATERKEATSDKINGLYTDKEITDELNIPPDYVKGFIFYAVEDAECAAALKAKKDDLAKLRMAALAIQYRELIEEDE